MSWTIGQAVGAYRIEEEIGRGGMATVYRAHHERLARDVAIKVVHPAHTTDADFMNRFEREAQVVAQLDHPHIVPVYDFDETAGQPYLVMKYIPGETLKQKFAVQPPPLDEIVVILEALADALTYAHQHGVLHRDIKPSNVIVDEGGTLHLTDFGLARLLQSGESSMSAGMIVGTPNYIAPEQASGDEEVTARADVYSLGVMLYEMVVGRVPFVSSSPFATVHKQIYEQPPLPSQLNPEVPTQVEMVLLRALEKDPADRYATPAELADAFKQAVETSGLKALSPERSSVVARQQRTSQPQPNPAPAKPKRGTSSTLPLLLLDQEKDWAHLSQNEIIRRRLKNRQGEQIGFLAHLLPYLAVNLGIIIGGLSDGGGLTSFITALAWGAGLAAHGLNVYYQSGRKIEQLYGGFYEHMEEEYGLNWQQTLDDETILEQWEAAKNRKDQWLGYRIHGAIFALINTMMWFIWGSSVMEAGEFIFMWPLITTLAWGLGLVMHGIQINFEMAINRDANSIAAELAMMDGSSHRAPRPAKQKNRAPQHDGEIRLTADGEFTESMAGELEQPRQARR